MDIEQIETFVTRTINEIADMDDAPTDTITALVQCQLLLHIYKKLEAIDEAMNAFRRVQ